jgi:hypothetical protein
LALGMFSFREILSQPCRRNLCSNDIKLRLRDILTYRQRM